MFPFRIWLNFVIGIICSFMCILLIFFPHEGIEAALRGISIWWDVLFPALFPFFVISEILLGFGIVHFIGTLLDPMMRPIFRVPGIGGFVLAMGFASGYPVGAKLTTQLWEQKLVTREEGERLVAFTSTSDPIFLIGAVSIGFFYNAGLAAILALSHYGSGIIVGLIMKYYGRTDTSIELKKQQGSSIFIVLRALRAMHEARMLDGRPFGLLLKHAVESSLKLVFMIGGLVVFFSVMLELLTLSHIMNTFYSLIEVVLRLFGLPEKLSYAVVNGFFEVTLGAKFAGEAGLDIKLIHKAAIAAFILSWGGLSVHAQIASILSHTHLRYFPFLMARLLHGFIAAFLVYLLWDMMHPLNPQIQALLPLWAVEENKIVGLSRLLLSALFIFIGVIILIIILFIIYKTYKFIQKKLL